MKTYTPSAGDVGLESIRIVGLTKPDVRRIEMKKHVVALLGGKASKTDLKHIKSFAFDPDEVTYSTGWVVMATPSDGEQRGNATLLIEPHADGLELTLTGSFVNKRKFDGDHFVAVAGLMNAEGKVVEKLQVKRGLDGMWKNLKFKTQRGGRTTRKVISSLDEVTLIVLSLGYHDAVSDSEFWEQAKEIAIKVAQALMADEEKETTNV